MTALSPLHTLLSKARDFLADFSVPLPPLGKPLIQPIPKTLPLKIGN